MYINPATCNPPNRYLSSSCALLLIKLCPFDNAVSALSSVVLVSTPFYPSPLPPSREAVSYRWGGGRRSPKRLSPKKKKNKKKKNTFFFGVNVFSSSVRSPFHRD